MGAPILEGICPRDRVPLDRSLRPDAGFCHECGWFYRAGPPRTDSDRARFGDMVFEMWDFPLLPAPSMIGSRRPGGRYGRASWTHTQRQAVYRESLVACRAAGDDVVDWPTADTVEECLVEVRVWAKEQGI